MSVLVELGRDVGIASLAGVIAGVAVGGLLGRVAMRVSGFMAEPEMVGVPTSAGERVGDITFEGTLALIVFTGIGSAYWVGSCTPGSSRGFNA